MQNVSSQDITSIQLMAEDTTIETFPRLSNFFTYTVSRKYKRAFILPNNHKISMWFFIAGTNYAF